MIDIYRWFEDFGQKSVLEMIKTKEFKQDLNRCLEKVLCDFPEFSGAKFHVIVNSSLNYGLGCIYEPNLAERHPVGAVKDYLFICGKQGVEALYDDDCKEGALAHELGEVLHIFKKGRESYLQQRRWYKKNHSYFTKVQMHTDLDAARHGYGPKLIKTLESIKQAADFDLALDLEVRINKLKEYLK